MLLVLVLLVRSVDEATIHPRFEMLTRFLATDSRPPWEIWTPKTDGQTLPVKVVVVIIPHTMTALATIADDVS